MELEGAKEEGGKIQEEPQEVESRYLSTLFSTMGFRTASGRCEVMGGRGGDSETKLLSSERG